MTARRTAGGNRRRRPAVFGALVAVVLLLATAMAVAPALDGPEATHAPRAPQAAAQADATVGPPAAAAPVAAAALPIDGDEALREHAAQRGWLGTGTADDPVRITDLQIRAHDRSGLVLRGTTLHVVIEQAAVEVTGTGDAIRLDHVSHVTITKTRTTGGGTGLRAVASHDVHVDNSTFETATIGWLLQGVREATIRDSRLAFNHVGVYADAKHGGDGASRALHVIGNTFFANVEPARAADTAARGAGVILAGEDHEVINNTFTGNGQAGIWMLANDTLVARNHLTDGLGHGILVTDAAGVQVHHNTLRGHPAAALSAQRTTGLHADGNVFVGAADTAIRVRDDHSSQLTHNAVTEAAGGIVAIRSSDLVVRGNTVERTTQGIDLVETQDTTVADNLVEGAAVGGINLFRAEVVSMSGNRVWQSAGHGIYVGDTSMHVRLHDNHIRSAPRGITVAGGAHDVLLDGDHVFGPGAVGIGVLDATDVQIMDPEIVLWDRGVHVWQGQGHRLEGGFVARCILALSIDTDAGPVHVSDATLTQNTAGVHIKDSWGHKVHRMNVVMNTEGVLLVDARQIEVAHNWIRDNRIGLHLVNATQNLVYDNLIVNDQLPGDQDFLTQNSAGNRWNVSERVGPNIVGGPRVGGNLWGGYQGPDADGDGLGDVPYWPVPVQSPDEELIALDDALALGGPLDMHPLVVDGDPEAGGAPGDQSGPPQDDEEPLVDPRLPLASQPPQSSQAGASTERPARP